MRKGVPPAPERPTPAVGRRINAAIVAAIVLIGVALLPTWRSVDSVVGVPAGVLSDAPAGITAALRSTAGPGYRLFNPQPWGSWFEFELPDVPVAIDSRVELFPTATWDEYEAIASGRDGWQAVLERWGATLVVAMAGDDAFVQRLQAAGWHEVFTDRDGTVLTGPSRNR